MQRDARLAVLFAASVFAIFACSTTDSGGPGRAGIGRCALVAEADWRSGGSGGSQRRQRRPARQRWSGGQRDGRSSWLNGRRQRRLGRQRRRQRRERRHRRVLQWRPGRVRDASTGMTPERGEVGAAGFPGWKFTKSIKLDTMAAGRTSRATVDQLSGDRVLTAMNFDFAQAKRWARTCASARPTARRCRTPSSPGTRRAARRRHLGEGGKHRGQQRHPVDQHVLGQGQRGRRQRLAGGVQQRTVPRCLAPGRGRAAPRRAATRTPAPPATTAPAGRPHAWARASMASLARRPKR